MSKEPAFAIEGRADVSCFRFFVDSRSEGPVVDVVVKLSDDVDGTSGDLAAVRECSVGMAHVGVSVVMSITAVVCSCRGFMTMGKKKPPSPGTILNV